MDYDQTILLSSRYTSEPGRTGAAKAVKFE